MRPIIFCNVGWMILYAGRDKRDPVINGGDWDREGGAGEACNFVRCPDGYLYGYVESARRRGRRWIDLSIHLTNLGAHRGDEQVGGIDVVWTATPSTGGRRVVGWYKNATVYKDRRHFRDMPQAVLSEKHKRAKLKSCRITTTAGNEVRLQEHERKQFVLEHGKGWMGQQQWWFPNETSPPSVRRFVRNLRRQIEESATATSGHAPANTTSFRKGGGSSLSTDKAYQKYVAKYEATILPVHRALQDEFSEFCRAQGFEERRYALAPVDGCFVNRRGELIFAEIKPCDVKTARYAIRTAMGQLLDYSQTGRPQQNLVVLGARPSPDALDLALSNGFAVAFKRSKKRLDFEIVSA